MIRWILKYGVVIFLANTVLLSITQTMQLGYTIFLFLMSIVMLTLIINPIEVKKVLFHKAFGFLLLINFLNLIYFISFHNFSDIEAIKYLLARGAQFSLIPFSIYYNFNYYNKNMFYHLAYIIFFIIILSVLLNPNIASGRYTGIIWNPNLFGAYCCLGFGMLLLDNKIKTRFIYFMLIVFFIMSLASGSRAVIVGLSLAFFIKFGFSLRNFLYATILSIIFIFLVNLQLETSFNRIYSQSILEDRILQFKYALDTFYSKFWTGYGLDKYSYIEKSLVPEHLRGPIKGAHNGYLALLVQYGVVFGGFILSIIFYKSFYFISSFFRFKNFHATYVFIILFALVAAIYESLLTGINMFHTVLFWFSLAFLSFSNYVKKKDYED